MSSAWGFDKTDVIGLNELSLQPGGMKAGTFDPYPSHSADAYGITYKRPVHVVNKTGKIFMPSPGPKSAPQSSIVGQNVIK